MCIIRKLLQKSSTEIILRRNLYTIIQGYEIWNFKDIYIWIVIKKLVKYIYMLYMTITFHVIVYEFRGHLYFPTICSNRTDAL